MRPQLTIPLQSLPARDRPLLALLSFAQVVASVLTVLYAPGLAAQERETALLNPAEIDRAVTAFTGVGVGEIGGARAPADRRLRLAACAQPLSTSWHGTTGNAVRVECTRTINEQGPWKIFVATRPAARAMVPSPASRPVPAAPIVKRGDPITVIVRGRGFSVQQSGEAVDNGHIGDWIGVRTARQTDPVRARIERPGLAIIPVG